MTNCSPTEPRRRGREGFTLVEVLVAMVILAVGLLALEALGIGAARMVARADRESQYTALAVERVERAMAQVAANPANVQTGEVDVDGAKVLTTLQTDALAGRTLYTVSVTVTPPPHQTWTLKPITVVSSVLP